MTKRPEAVKILNGTDERKKQITDRPKVLRVRDELNYANMNDKQMNSVVRRSMCARIEKIKSHLIA